MFTEPVQEECLTEAQIIAKMSDDPDKWRICDRDRFGLEPYRARVKQCGKCQKFGHNEKHCPVLKMSCFLCGNTGHRTYRCAQIHCSVCLRRGHLMEDCYTARRKCLTCGVSGHMAEHCAMNWKRFLTITDFDEFVKHAKCDIRGNDCDTCSISRFRLAMQKPPVVETSIPAEQQLPMGQSSSVQIYPELVCQALSTSIDPALPSATQQPSVININSIATLPSPIYEDVSSSSNPSMECIDTTIEISDESMSDDSLPDYIDLTQDSEPEVKPVKRKANSNLRPKNPLKKMKASPNESFTKPLVKKPFIKFDDSDPEEEFFHIPIPGNIKKLHAEPQSIQSLEDWMPNTQISQPTFKLEEEEDFLDLLSNSTMFNAQPFQKNKKTNQNQKARQSENLLTNASSSNAGDSLGTSAQTPKKKWYRKKNKKGNASTVPQVSPSTPANANTPKNKKNKKKNKKAKVPTTRQASTQTPQSSNTPKAKKNKKRKKNKKTNPTTPVTNKKNGRAGTIPKIAQKAIQKKKDKKLL